MGTNTRKGHAKRLMLSLAKKEATFGADVAVSEANFDLMSGYLMTPEYADEVVDNAEEVHGSEIATAQETFERSVKLPYETPKCLPNEVAGLGALVAGSETENKDGAVNAWRHDIQPVAEGTELVSINAILDPVNAQQRIVGLKGSMFELSSEELGGLAFKCDLMGSGKRTDSAESWYDPIAEVLLRAADTKVYLNPTPDPATDIIAVGSLSQITDNISSGQSLTALGARVMSWKFGHNNNIEELRGHGGGGYNQDLDFNAREYTVEMVLRYKDKTERDYFEDDTYFALEFNNARISSGVIAATGAFYFGADLRIPKVKLSVRPVEEGGVKDPYTISLVGKILDDGTNPPYLLAVYNAIETYLGA